MATTGTQLWPGLDTEHMLCIKSLTLAVEATVTYVPTQEQASKGSKRICMLCYAETRHHAACQGDVIETIEQQSSTAWPNTAQQCVTRRSSGPTADASWGTCRGRLRTR